MNNLKKSTGKDAFLPEYENILRQYLVHHDKGELCRISRLSELAISKNLQPKELLEIGKEALKNIIPGILKEQQIQIALDSLELLAEAIIPYGAMYVEMKGLTEKLRLTNQELNESQRLLHETQVQLIRSERLAAMGQLAAGVAHEVNNPVTIIKLSVDALLHRSANDDQICRKLKNIMNEINRVAKITQSLLAFSRKHDEIQKIRSSLNGLIDETLETLENQLILNNIKITRVFDGALPKIDLNPYQIQQVILNLINNARDAMPRGGEITIETCRGTVEHKRRRKTDILKTGQKIAMVKFSDTGTGMSEEVRKKNLHPVFHDQGGRQRNWFGAFRQPRDN